MKITHTNCVCKTTMKHSSKASFKFKRMECHFFFFFHLHFCSPAFTPVSERYTQNHKQALIKSKLQVKVHGMSFFNLYFHFYSPALTPLSERYTQNHKQALIKSKLQACELFFAFVFLHFYSPAFIPLPEIHTYIRNDNSTAKRSIL